MIFPFQDTLAKLWNEARGDFLGGLLLAIVLAIGGVVIAIFRRSILLVLKKLFNLEPANSKIHATSQPVQLPPQPLILKLEGVSSLPPPPNTEVSPPIAPIQRSTIPRPPLAGFVARRDESGREIVERLRDELQPEKERLIVLWGAGGVGKTTLAAETARAMRDVFRGGIVWTTADGKPDYTLSTLLDEIATQLGRADLRQLAPESKDEAVHQLLSTASATLIVLDNFETISPTEQERCAQWLANRASCPALITSRDQVEPAKPVRILAMSLPEAREFLQRLMTELGNPQAFRNLDPEQIIQAAGRIPRVLQWVVRQIDSARQPQMVLDELAHGGGDAAERVFDRSFDLPQLGDDGRATLLALSLFVPDASRTALAEVAGFENDLTRLDRAVQQLVQLWLVQTTAGNERLSVEGLTRELARARLARDPNVRDYRRRFVTFFRRYGEEHGQQRTEDFNALEAERDNLLNAVDYAFDLGEWQTVQYLAFAIAEPTNGWLGVCGYWSEALRVNKQALDASRLANADHQGAPFGHNMAVVYGNRGESAKARTLYGEGLRVFKMIGDEYGTAVALHQLGVLARREGAVEEARKLYNESLVIKKRVGDETGISSCLHQLAMIAQEEGEFEEARRLYDESLEISKRLGALRSISIGLHQLAVLAQEQGEHQEARELYDESLRIKRQLGDQRGIAASLHELGRLAHHEGEISLAHQLYDESLIIKKKLGDQSGIALTMHNLGVLAERQGNKTEAISLFRGALDILVKLKSPVADTVRQALERVNANERE